jgi:RNA polymerase sigma-70 factor, ECF subfamily
MTGPADDVTKVTSARVGQYVQIRAVAQAQNHAAFAELFKYFAPRVKAWMIRSGVDAATADEIAQETLARVWRNASSFDSNKSTLSSWIFCIARDLRSDASRKAQRIAPFRAAYYGKAVADDCPADQIVAITEREFRLKLALKDLPIEQATVIRKAFLEGKSHRTIELELHIPLGTVKARIRLAIKRLRARLDDLA